MGTWIRRLPKQWMLGQFWCSTPKLGCHPPQVHTPSTGGAQWGRPQVLNAAHLDLSGSLSTGPRPCPCEVTQIALTEVMPELCADDMPEECSEQLGTELAPSCSHRFQELVSFCNGSP